jgi:predicted  nucleic acid-binding Zn-ribbon protein
MSDKIFETIFTNAATRYMSAKRWHVVVIISVMLFQATVITHFIRLTETLHSTETRLAHTEKIFDQFKNAQEKLSDLQKWSQSKLEKKISSLIKSLKGAFQTLDNEVGVIKSPLQYGDENILNYNTHLTDSKIQESALNRSKKLPIPIKWTKSLKKKVKKVSDSEQLIKILKPFIEKNILTPLFNSAREDWEKNTAPVFINIITDFNQSLNKIHFFNDNRNDIIDREKIVSALKEYKQKFISLDFAVTGDDWWRSMRGKEKKISAMGREIETPLNRLLNTFNDSMASVNREVKSQKEKMDTLQTDYEKQNQEITSKLDQLKLPFQFFVPDIMFVIRLFPISWAVLIASTTLLVIFRLRELAAIASVNGGRDKSGDKGIGIWELFFIQTGFERGLPGNKKAYKYTPDAIKSHCRVKFTVCCLFYLVWGIFTFFQVCSIGNYSWTLAMGIGACMVLVVGGAMVWRWVSEGEVLMLSENMGNRGAVRGNV